MYWKGKCTFNADRFIARKRMDVAVKRNRKSKPVKFWMQVRKCKGV